jgi:hypothetical protein
MSPHTKSSPAFALMLCQPFYSPSSKDVLIKHPSDRVFWVGNITPENADGDSPRWPIVVRKDIQQA